MDLNDFVRQCEEAWQVFVTGDPCPAMLLFSRRNDVTLANPWGPGCDGMGRCLQDAGGGGHPVP